MRRYLPLVAALGLLLLVACSDSDDAPSAADTPAVAATATAVIGPTQPNDAPESTATPPGPTPTRRPAVEGRCPIDDDDFCDVAEALDGAFREGRSDIIVVSARLASQRCSGLEQIGPCFGLDEALVLSGYLAGIDASDSISYLSGQEYVALLDAISDGSVPAASDEFGNGTWRLFAVLDESPDMKVLVTTSIGPDPIYDVDEPERRVFLFRLQHSDGAWRISVLLTTVFIAQNLTGTHADGSLVDGWLRWGE